MLEICQKLGIDLELSTKVEQRAAFDTDIQDFIEALENSFKSYLIDNDPIKREEAEHASAGQRIDLSKECSELSEKILSLESELEVTNSERTNLKEENQKLALNFEKESLEKAKLHRQLNDLFSQVSLLNQEKLPEDVNQIDLQSVSAQINSQYSELQGSLLTAESQIQQLEVQINTLSDHNSLLQKELDFKNEELRSVIENKEKDIASLHTSYNEEHLGEHQNQVEELNKQREALLAEIQTLKETLQEQTAQATAQKENFDNEISAKQRLIDMHIKTNQEFDSENRSLKEQISELKAQHFSSAQRVLSLEKESQAKQAELLSQVESLKHDLIQYSDLGASSQPIINDTIQLLTKAQKTGKSFSEVYKNYVDVKQELIVNQCNSRAMYHSISSLTHALETQVPLLKEQKMDYDRLLDEANELATLFCQLSVTHRETLKILAELEQKESLLNLENQKLRAETSNPGLKTDSSSSSTIAKLEYPALVEQNHRLKASLSELQKRIDVSESQFLVQINELEKSFEQEWKSRSQEVDSSSHSLKTRIKALEAEREMLIQLIQSKSPESVSSDPAIKTDIHKDTEILRLKNELEQITVQHLASFKLLQQQYDDLLSQRENQITKSACFEAQVQGLQDQNKSLVEQSSHHAREVQELRRRNIDLESLLIKREKLYEKMSQEMEEMRGQYEVYQIKLSGTLAEGTIAKKNETRLSSEIKSLIREKSFLNTSLINLRLNFETLRQREQKTLFSHENQLSAVEEQCKILQDSLNQAQASKTSLQQEYSKDLFDKQQKIDRLDSTVHEINSKLLTTEESLQLAQSRIDSLKEESAKIKALFEDVSNSGVSGEELLSTLNDLQKAREELALRSQSETQYQAISKASEEALLALQETYQEYKTSSEKNIVEKEQQIQALSTQLEESNIKIDALQESLTKETSDFKKKSLNLLHGKEQADNALAEANEKIKELNSRHSADEAQIASLTVAVDNARSSYERELASHSAKVKEFMLLKKDFISIQRQNVELQDQLSSCQEELESLSKLSESQKETRDSQIKDLELKIESLDLQNRELSIQLKSGDSSYQSQNTHEAIKTNIDASLNSNQHELIKAKLQAFEAATKRLELEKEFDGKSLSKLRQNFNEYRELSEARLEESKQKIADLVQKTNILEESSTYNRKENERHLEKIQKLTKKTEADKEKILKLEEKLVILKEEISTKEAKLTSTQEEVDSWKTRTQEILDRAELDNSEELIKTREEKKTLQAQLFESQSAYEKVSSELKETQERHTVLVKELEDKIGRLNRTGLNFKKRYEQLNAEKEKGGLSSEEKAAFASLKESHGAMSLQLTEAASAKTALETRIVQLNDSLQKAKDAMKSHGDSKTEATEQKTLQEKVESLSSELASEKEKYSKLLTQARKLKKMMEDFKSENSLIKDNLARLTEELEAKNIELQKLKEADQGTQDSEALSEKISALTASHQQALDELSSAKDEAKELEIKQLVQDHDTKLKHIEMRHNLQLSKLQRNNQKLTEEIDHLKAEAATQEVKSSGDLDTGATSALLPENTSVTLPNNASASITDDDSVPIPDAASVPMADNSTTLQDDSEITNLKKELDESNEMKENDSGLPLAADPVSPTTKSELSGAPEVPDTNEEIQISLEPEVISPKRGISPSEDLLSPKRIRSLDDTLDVPDTLIDSVTSPTLVAIPEPSEISPDVDLETDKPHSSPQAES